MTARLTFAGGERCISVCADHGQTLPAPRAARYRNDLGQALFFDGSTPFILARQKKWGRKGSRAKRPATNGKAHTQKLKERGGNPLIGFPPRTLVLIFNKHQEVPPAAAGGQGLCPCTPPPLKRWTKLSFALRADYCRPNLRRVVVVALQKLVQLVLEFVTMH